MKPSRRILWQALLVTIWLGALSACLSNFHAQSSENDKTVRVVMDNNYPPYAFEDSSGEMQGISVDQWQLWSQRSGIKVKITGMEWEQALASMKRGEFDVIDTIFYTEERAKIFDYSLPYADIDVRIFFPSGVSGIAVAEHLQGFRVAVKASDANAEYLKAKGVTDLSYYENYEDIIRAAQEKRESIFVIDEQPALYFLYKYDMQDKFKYSAPLYGGQFHRAVKKGNTELLRLLENGFDDISAAEYQQIETRWLGSQTYAQTRALIPYAAGAAALTFLVFTALVIFNRTLAAQVSKRTQELQETLNSLRASEARFREAIEFLPVPIGIADQHGNIVTHNRKFIETYGYELPETPNVETWYQLAYPDEEYRRQTIAQWKKDVEQATISQQASPTREYKVRGGDGRDYDVEITMRAIDSLWITSFINVTERKQAEEKIRQSEARYRALFEDSPVALLEEDFSEARRILDELSASGVKNLREHLQTHPQDLARCVHGIQILDTNQQAMNWYQIKDRDKTRGSLKQFIPTSAYGNLINELLTLYAGNRQYQATASRPGARGEMAHMLIHTSVAPKYEDTWERVVVSIVDVTRRKNAEDALARQLEFLHGLRAIDQAIITQTNLTESLNVLMSEITLQLEVDAAAISLFQSGGLKFAAGRGFRFAPQDFAQKNIASGLAQRAAREQHEIHIRNLQDMDYPAAFTRAIAQEGFIPYYGLPLSVKDETLGVLEIFQRSPLERGEEWKTFLETLAGQAAITIENAILFERLQDSNLKLQQAYDITLEGWSRALDLRDKETEGHTRRVSDLAVKLARKINFPEEQIIHLMRGALLHDIGKMGIPDSILLKPGPLNKEEWEVMKKHPLYAYEMLSPIEYLKPALDIPHYHHERWDGGGYPRGLRGERIPLTARIFTLADVWDALTSNRPYRAAWSAEKTKSYMQEQSGRHFDPRVLTTFFNMLAEDGI